MEFEVLVFKERWSTKADSAYICCVAGISSGLDTLEEGKAAGIPALSR